MNYTLISPRLAIQKGDFLGSGVPYWPVELAVLAGFLEAKRHSVQVIDLFGTKPTRLSDKGDYYLQGEPIETFDIDSKEIIVIYAISYMSHEEVLNITYQLKKKGHPVFVLENSQAVTGYAIDEVKKDFFDVGADGLLIGEVYSNWNEIEAYIAGKASEPIPTNLVLASSEKTQRIYKSLEVYPAPAWEKFPLENYWKLPYSHGPKVDKFLPVLTSRGCPYPCNFCVVPTTNERKFRGRTVEDIVGELIYLRDKFGIHHFQVEDLNPTVQKNRWPEISRRLSEREAGIFYYFVSGTKAETVPVEEVPTLAKGGCRYISISPESGSAKVMKDIGKPFDYEHGAKLVEACAANGIFTQACFLVGHPAEAEEDHELSKKYLKRLLRAGLDEAAIFVVAPFAGSALFKSNAIALKDKKNMVSFSPKGRADWEVVEKRRSELIRLFFQEKLKRGSKIWMQGLRSVFGRPKTKMENLPRRMAYVAGLVIRNKFTAKSP